MKNNSLTSKQKTSLTHFRNFDLGKIEDNHHKLTPLDIANLENTKWHEFSLSDEDSDKIVAIKNILPSIKQLQQEKLFSVNSRHKPEEKNAEVTEAY
jgi:hypothetical protein